MKNLKAIAFALLATSILFFSCKKDETSSPIDGLAGTYTCLLNENPATLKVTKKSDEQVSIQITPTTKALEQITFDNVDVKKLDGNNLRFELASTELAEGEILYLENGKSHEILVKWTDGQAIGFKNQENLTVAKEICGFFNGNMNNITVNAVVTEINANEVNIKLTSQEPNFSTIELNNIRVDKYVIDSVGRLAICPYYELTNSPSLNYSKLDFLELENKFEMRLHFTDSKFYFGVLQK